MLFEKTRQQVSDRIDTKVTRPIQTATIVASLAVAIALVALLVAVSK